VVFTIATTSSEIPNNQLLICDRIQDIGGIMLHYIGLVQHPYLLISNDAALAVLVLSPEITEAAAGFIKVTFATLGMRYVGPPE
jgi:hypothetical protein